MPLNKETQLKLVLTPASYPQPELQLQLQLQLQHELNWLTQTICGTWLYNCWTTTCFLWAYASAPNSTMSTGQGDIPISSTGYTCFLIDGSVEGQYVTRV